MKAVEELTDTTLDDVNYKSSLSHTLTKFLTGEAVAPLTVNEPVTVGKGFVPSSTVASSTATTNAPVVIPDQPSWMLHQAQAQAQALQAQAQAQQQAQYQSQQQLAYLQLQQQQQLIQQQMSTLLFQAQQQQQQQMMNNTNNNGGSKILGLVQQHQQQQQQRSSLGMLGSNSGGFYSNNNAQDLFAFSNSTNGLSALNGSLGLEQHLNMNASPFTPMAQQQQQQQQQMMMGNLGLGLNNLSLSSPQTQFSTPSMQLMPSLQMPLPLNNNGMGLGLGDSTGVATMMQPMVGLPMTMPNMNMPVGMNVNNMPAPMNMPLMGMPLPQQIQQQQQLQQQQQAAHQQAVQQQQQQAAQQQHAQQQQQHAPASPQVMYSTLSPAALPRWIASPSMSDAYVNNLLYSPGHIYQLSPSKGKSNSALSSPLVPASALMSNGNMHVPLIMQQLQSPLQKSPYQSSPLQQMQQSPQQQQVGGGGGGSLTGSPMSFNRDIVQSREAVRSSTAMRKGARSMSSLLRKTLHPEAANGSNGGANGTHGMAEDKGAGGMEDSTSAATSPGKPVEAIATNAAGGTTAVSTH